ncbi:MAG: hybrid sensor histidine kinase/response regulator [Pseudomonadota bacterium]
MSMTKVKERPRVLAVDDAPDNLFLIQAILEDEGYCLDFAQDGPKALTKIEQNPPDLVLLDIMMPGMDGYEVTRKIRKNRNLPFIPILLITAHEHSSVVQGLDTGADDFIRKPFDLDELLARVRALLRLKHSIDAEQAIARQRADFVSRLTHDLRTPLVAANRVVKLLTEGAFGPVSSESVSALEGIERNNDNLLQMINTLLEVHRHESGEKAMAFIDLDLWELVTQVAEELRPLAESKDLTFQVVCDDALISRSKLRQVAGDRMELRRLLTNLIGNAIKFTDAGAVSIALQCQSALLSDEDNFGEDNSSKDNGAGRSNRTKDQTWLAVSVKDTGIGISSEEQQGIFQWFRQGNHRRAGSGLGLHLAQRIATAHQGTVSLKSSLGQGSTFTLLLPVAVNSAAPKVGKSA